MKRHSNRDIRFDWNVPA